MGNGSDDVIDLDDAGNHPKPINRNSTVAGLDFTKKDQKNEILNK